MPWVDVPWDPWDHRPDLEVFHVDGRDIDHWHRGKELLRLRFFNAAVLAIFKPSPVKFSTFVEPKLSQS